METKIKFSNLNHNFQLKNEVLNLFSQKLEIKELAISEKNWSYAKLDDKQILGKDAKNLSDALKYLGCLNIYGAWACDFFERDDFDVEVIPADSLSIERAQGPESRLDHMSTFFFSDYPLKFLIMRPDSFDNFLYFAGQAPFLAISTKEEGWSRYFL